MPYEIKLLQGRFVPERTVMNNISWDVVVSRSEQSFACQDVVQSVQMVLVHSLVWYRWVLGNGFGELQIRDSPFLDITISFAILISCFKAYHLCN